MKMANQEIEKKSQDASSCIIEPVVKSMPKKQASQDSRQLIHQQKADIIGSGKNFFKSSIIIWSASNSLVWISNFKGVWIIKEGFK